MSRDRELRKIEEIEKTARQSLGKTEEQDIDTQMQKDFTR